MTRIAITKMSSKGQVVIPEEVRKRLHLESGHLFVVLAENDTIILKALMPPSQEEFSAMLEQTHKAVKKAGITPGDLDKEIKKAGRKKK